jgi:interferon-induced GTP-binding protein Mx
MVDNLLDSFLEKERTIVLAIVPANVDIATVDIIERAAGSDPEGNRTICCMTKLDLTAPGADNDVTDVIRYVSKLRSYNSALFAAAFLNTVVTFF